MKADLKKYRGYTVLFNAHITDSGVYTPSATLFKTGEDAVKLIIKRTFTERDQALSYALGAAEEAINLKLKGKKPDFELLVGEG